MPKGLEYSSAGGGFFESAGADAGLDEAGAWGSSVRHGITILDAAPTRFLAGSASLEPHAHRAAPFVVAVPIH
jgi:hypothetical protein